MTHPPEVITRESIKFALESKGVTGKALECLLRETARERHRSRVAFARWAAEEYWLRKFDLPREEVAKETLHLVAGAILWADVIGIGGYDGVEGKSTIRHPALECCGKGRKQAMDGGAWSAAIIDAAFATRGRFLVNDKGSLVYAILDQEPSQILVDAIIVPTSWIFSIVREGLRRAAGMPSWHPYVPFDAPQESLEGWSKLYNLVAEDQVSELMCLPRRQ